MNTKAIAIAASVIGITFTNISVANISTTQKQTAPLTTIQLAEHGRANDNIQLADAGVAFVAGAIVGAAAGSAATRSRVRRGYYYYYRDPYYRPVDYRRVYSRSAYSRPIYPRPVYRHTGYWAAQDRCARRYRSYSYRTDTFITYSGYEKLCPYIRPWH